MAANKILIVEDEAPIREMIAFHLGRAGYEWVPGEVLKPYDCTIANESE